MWYGYEKRRGRTFARCLLTLWLCVSGNFCAPAGASSLGTEEVLHVPGGWTSALPGYWLSEEAGRDMAAGWSADRAERDTLRSSLSAQFERAEDILARWRAATAELEAQIAIERSAHAAELRRLKRALHRPGFIIGVGFAHEGEFRGIVGIGWKF